MWIQNDGVTYEWIKRGRGYLSACNADSPRILSTPLTPPDDAHTCHWSATKPRTEVGNCLVDAFGLCEQVTKTMLGICAGSLIFSQCFLVFIYTVFFCLSVANKNLTRSNLLWLNLPSVCVGKNRPTAKNERKMKEVCLEAFNIW